MRFRPCIDIHNGKVKQIVGSSLRDAGDFAEENFMAGPECGLFCRTVSGQGAFRGTCDPAEPGRQCLF